MRQAPRGLLQNFSISNKPDDDDNGGDNDDDNDDDSGDADDDSHHPMTYSRYMIFQGTRSCYLNTEFLGT